MCWPSCFSEERIKNWHPTDKFPSVITISKLFAAKNLGLANLLILHNSLILEKIFAVNDREIFCLNKHRTEDARIYRTFLYRRFALTCTFVLQNPSFGTSSNQTGPALNLISPASFCLQLDSAHAVLKPWIGLDSYWISNYAYRTWPYIINLVYKH